MVAQVRSEALGGTDGGDDGGDDEGNDGATRDSSRLDIFSTGPGAFLLMPVHPSPTF